jgi:hypothetical protein
LYSPQVDAAVEMVEQNNLEGAVSVLKEGIATFEPNFPGRYAAVHRPV